jgi:hypothetical protein
VEHWDHRRNQRQHREPGNPELLLQTEPVTVDETIKFIQERGQQAFDMEE